MILVSDAKYLIRSTLAMMEPLQLEESSIAALMEGVIWVSLEESDFEDREYGTPCFLKPGLTLRTVRRSLWRIQGKK